MKTIFFLFTTLLLISSCSWVDNKQAKAYTNAAITGDSSSKTPSGDILKYRRAIRAFADSTFKNGTLNGSFLVAKDGQVLFEQYEGYSHYRAQKDSITVSTPFHLASVSKTITATAILRLVQEGKITLDDPVSTFFPGFPKPAITVKLLLNHRSGLPNYVHYMERLGWDKKKRISNQDVLDFIIARHNEIAIAPADRGFSYSNTNYALLALIIEKITGLSYSAYLKQTIFDPLGMKDTYVYSLADSGRSMPSYFYSGKQYAFDFLDLVYGDKNIYSTVQDLLKFTVALSSGSFLNTSLSEATLTPYSFEKPGTHNYGLGWRMLLLKNGKKLVYHNGWWHGNRTALYWLPEEKVTIIALCNNDSKRIYSIKKLADLFGDYLQNGDNEEDFDKMMVRNRSTRGKYKKRTIAKLHSKIEHSRPIASKN